MDNRNHTILKRLLLRLSLISVLTVTATVQAADSFGERLRGLFSGTAESASGETFLPVDEAFRLHASVTGPASLDLSWRIADGYYLYRDRFQFRILQGEASIEMRAVSIPRGVIKEDEAFGSVEVNTGDISVAVPLRRRSRDRTDIVLQVAYQGCKEDAVCYPPVRREIPMTLSAGE